MEDSTTLKKFSIEEKYKINITDNYEIKEIIGFGSFGVVSKVLRKHDKQIFAMKKIFIKKLPFVSNAVHETLTEISILSQCSHRNIINFVGYEVLDNEISYIMELMCYSLEDYMKEKLIQSISTIDSVVLSSLPELNKSIILKIFYQSLSALNYLLMKFNMSHRDIKPENILLDENFEVKISDFGTLKVMQETTNKGFLTKTETLVGTPCYLAPELKRTLLELEAGNGALVKPKVNFSKCDVFSLGMTILRLIAGEKFEKGKGIINVDEDCLRQLMVEVKNEIPIEIYDTLFIMLSYDVNIRPDVKMLYLMVQKKENMLHKVDGLKVIKEEDKDCHFTGNILKLQKKQSIIMDLSNSFDFSWNKI